MTVAAQQVKVIGFPVGLIAYNGSYTVLHMCPIKFKEISYCEIYALPESIRNV